METALKQRLVGASVIIALAVIFIPMLFDDSPDNKQPISIDIPQEPDDLKHQVISLENKKTSTNSSTSSAQSPKIEQQNSSLPATIETTETIVDISQNKHDEPDELEVTEHVAQEPAKESAIKPAQNPTKEPIKKAQKETQPAKKVINPKKKPKQKPKIAPKIEGESIYRIKLGAFSQNKNAQKLKAQIIQKGLEAHIEKDEKSNLYKVYSRQYTTLAAAENLNKKIQKLDLKLGKTTVEKISKTENTNIQAQLDTGWIVQIGIFSSKSNALKLRDKIRKKGFISFVDEILNAKNQLNYRVRIGPYATREEADSKKSAIFKAMQLKGLLKPHEKNKVVTK